MRKLQSESRRINRKGDLPKLVSEKNMTNRSRFPSILFDSIRRTKSLHLFHFFFFVSVPHKKLASSLQIKLRPSFCHLCLLLTFHTRTQSLPGMHGLLGRSPSSHFGGSREHRRRFGESRMEYSTVLCIAFYTHGGW